jgi:hypothetical protein
MHLPKIKEFNEPDIPFNLAFGGVGTLITRDYH